MTARNAEAYRVGDTVWLKESGRTGVIFAVMLDDDFHTGLEYNVEWEDGEWCTVEHEDVLRVAHDIWQVIPLPAVQGEKRE